MSMSTSSNPLTRVLARPVAEGASSQPGLVRLSWSQSVGFARRVQVYVDAELYDVSADPADRAMWLLLDPSVPHRFDLLAVADDAEAWVDHSGRIRADSGLTRPVVAGDLSLPIGNRLIVEHADGRSWSRPVYRGADDRPGFGAAFGAGGFGYDLSIGSGLGRGTLGLGPLGVGGEPIRLRPQALGPGEHALSLYYEPPDASSPSPPQALVIDRDDPVAPVQSLALLGADTIAWS